METDFSALRQHLVGAWLNASGRDEITRRIRSVLGSLIEEVLFAESGRATAGFPFVANRSGVDQSYAVTFAETDLRFDGTLVLVKAFARARG